MVEFTRNLRGKTNVLLVQLVLGVWGLLIGQFFPQSLAN